MARIFVGIEVSSRIREQLDSVGRSEEIYFRFDDPRYLTIARDNDHEFLGRWLEDPVSFEMIDNIHSNIASIIKLILPHNRLTRDHFKFFLLEGESEIL